MGVHNFGSSPHFLDTMLSSFYPLDVYVPESQLNLMNDWNNCAYPISCSSIYNVDSDEYVYRENSTAQLSSYNMTLPENFPHEHVPIDCCFVEDPQQKRMRTIHDDCFSADYRTTTLLSAAKSTESYLVKRNLSPEFGSSGLLPISLNCQKAEATASAISPQSIAARLRRKRISEKTQELGRLVPGGAKMNTAEMLAAAAKYVKFLQAQVRILEFLKHSTSDQEDEKALSTFVQLQGLPTSTTIQEKLYDEEKCILPIESVKSLQGNAVPSRVEQ